ncbi:MAG: hypothetical protein R3C05_18960 [Pirellulaceae bacterium]
MESLRIGRQENAYVVELCQESSGRRYTRYRDVETGALIRTRFSGSKKAIGQQFIDWRYYKYAEHLHLNTGECFTFDAHGIWLTYTEVKRMRDRDNPWWEGDQSFWVNGIAPLFPPA